MNRTLLLGMAILLCGAAAESMAAQELDQDASAAIVKAVEARLAAEVAAFGARDCTTALQFYDDEALVFVSGGRVTRGGSSLAARCPAMVARIPPGFSRPVAAHSRSRRARRPPVAQVVTKVWSLREGQWLIVHFHESIQLGPA